MVGKHFTKTVVVLLIVFLTSLYLETELSRNTGIELFFLLVAVLISVIATRAIREERKWAWPLTTILFSAMLFNLLFLYLQTNNYAIFSLGALFNIIGLAMSTGSVGKSLDFIDEMVAQPLETYKIPKVKSNAVEPQVVYGNRKVKKAKRVSTRKKAKKKTSRRKKRR